SYSQVGRILSELGPKADAADAFENAQRMFQDLLKAQPDRLEYRLELAGTENRLFLLRGCRWFPFLVQAPVQDDLRLTETQKTQIRDMERRLDQQRATLCDTKTTEERERLFADYAKVNEKTMAGILDTPQLERLHQIDYQLRSIRSLSAPE